MTTEMASRIGLWGARESDRIALRGVRVQAASAAALLRRNLLIYGLGGILVPFVGIKAIDMLLTALHLV